MMRCRVCPRCGSGSYRRARADAVVPLFRVRECRRCSQQYRLPTPWWLSAPAALAGAGMMVPLVLRFREVRFDPSLWQPLWKPILAGSGLLLAMIGLFKLAFYRGVAAPAVNADGASGGAAASNGTKAAAGATGDDASSDTASAPKQRRSPHSSALIGLPINPAARPLPALRGTTGGGSPGGAQAGTLASPLVVPASARPSVTARAGSPPAAPPPASAVAPAAVAVAAPVAPAIPLNRLPLQASHAAPLHFPMPPAVVLAALRRGAVIPAHPLAINNRRAFDERRMRALTRYYLAAGAGGVAVGVHATQFDIRKPKHNLLAPVLTTVMDELSRHEQATGKPLIKIAGICGPTRQAVEEAELAARLGYDIGLLNLAAMPAGTSEFDLMAHCKHVAHAIPLMGFLLHAAAGGRELPGGFWRAFVTIPNVVGIKVAAFNRYRTLDLMRIVAEAGRALPPAGLNQGAFSQSVANPIVIYTGNDDNILGDLLGEWTFPVGGAAVSQRIVGGLLGHWACWTRAAAEVFESLRRINDGPTHPAEVTLLNRQITDMNSAVFDAANNFKGCIPGIHEVLYRQGLLEGNWCLDQTVGLSEGQAEEITRVIHAYPHLTDSDFVEAHRREWLT